jgi:drug/metabolite transporter (DMT)-like permease
MGSGNGRVYATVVLIRLIYAGMHILTKAAFNEGTSTTVFVFYRHAVATIFLLPFAFLEIRYPFIFSHAYILQGRSHTPNSSGPAPLINLLARSKL